MTHLPHQRRRSASRLARIVGLSAVLVVVAASAASAHVSVSPSSAVRGSTAELVFRVPNEEGSAATTKIQIQIPTTQPIAQLLAKPIPGWTVTEHTVKLAKPLVTDDGTFTSAVDEVTWSGGRIEPGEYQDFALSADPLPSSGTQVVFKALQTYSNGEVVRWIDLQQPGQDEPEHPAPVLALTSSSEAMAMSMDMGTTTVAATTTDSSSSWPGVVSILSLAVALLALALVVMLLRRARTVE